MTGWIDKTPGLLDIWHGGQESGHALASILFGGADLSGKLPVTLPKRFEDSPAHGHYPVENLRVDYASDIRLRTPLVLAKRVSSDQAGGLKKGGPAQGLPLCAAGRWTGH